MSLLPQLQRASFNGIPFLIKKCSTTGGRKLATHEFVRSNRRFVEDLGLNNRTFHITGIITGFDYLLKREALLREIELPGQGLLQHPFYGRPIVTAFSYTVKENLQKAGEATIEMKFEEGEAQSQPLPNSFFSNALAEELAAELAALLAAEFAEKYGIPAGAQNFGDAISQNANVGSFFQGAFSQPGLNQSTADYTNTLNNFNNNIVELVSQPEKMASSVNELVDKGQLLFSEPADSFGFLSKGFSFNSVGITLTTETRSNTQRENNRKAVVDIMRGMNLGSAYNQAAQIKFTLARDLEQVKDSLDDSFNDMINNTRMGNESVEKLEQLRNAANIIFDTEEVNLFKIETIRVQTQPVGIIAFSHYGDTDLEETLIELNEVANPSFINGEFRILTR